jgi:hypothetical protein
MRAIGQAENNGKYTGENDQGCAGRYQFCPGGSYGYSSGKSDGIGGVFPARPASMSPTQQDLAFVNGWEGESFRNPNFGINTLISTLQNQGIDAAILESNKGLNTGGRIGFCGGWTPLCLPSNDPDGQGKTSLIKSVYNAIIEEEKSGNCGSKTSKADNQNNSITLATVTNNFKQFFQPIRAEAASDGRNLVVDGIPAGIAYRETGSLAGVAADQTGGGIDFTISLTGDYDTGSKGAPVISHLSGEVTYVVNDQKGVSSGFGNEVGVYYPSIGVTAIYSHMDSVVVKVGDLVSPGSFLGGQGSTGSTRPPDFNHISLNLIKGKVNAQGGESSDISGLYNSFLKSMMTYYATNLEKIKAKDYSPTAPGSGSTTTTSGPVICCPPGVTPSGAANGLSQAADIDGLSEDGKRLLGGISAIIEQKEGAVTTVPGGFGVGFEKYNNPGNITASSSLQSEKSVIDKKFPVSAADKAKGITSYVSKDLKNPRFLAFYTPEIGRWYLQDYILFQITQGEGGFKTAQTWGDFMRAYAPPQDNNATNRPGQGDTGYIDMFKGLGLVDNTPLSEVKSKLGISNKTSFVESKVEDSWLQKLASTIKPIKANAQGSTNGIEKAQIIIFHITAGGNGSATADQAQLSYVRNPKECKIADCASYNELILSNGTAEKLQEQGGRVVGTAAGWIYNIDTTTWKAGNVRIAGPAGSGTMNRISYQISFPYTKLKGEEGDRISSGQVRATAQTLSDFARAGGRAENIFTHAALDPGNRADDRPFININGTVNSQLVEVVSQVRANGQWKSGNYQNMSDQELATIITLINIENSIAAAEKSGDSAVSAAYLNGLKAASAKLAEQLKSKNFQIDQGTGTTTANVPAGCVQASASNNSPGTNKPGNVPSNGGKTQNSGTYDTAFLKKLADGILSKTTITGSDCYAIVAGFGSVLEGLDPDMILSGLATSPFTKSAYMFHDFMQASSGGVPNYVKYGYEYSNDTAKLQRGSIVVLSGAINADRGGDGDVNIYIGTEEMASRKLGGDGWMGRTMDNASLASDILGIYTKIKK